jgi:methylase of polypeptide subunit release factors
VLGAGAGLEAACIALNYEILTDATDINPVAVANTMATARRLGVEHLIRAWVSDGFKDIEGKYDAIIFEAPLATREIAQNNANLYDGEGKLLRAVLADLPRHLNPSGRMYLMSHPDLSPYISAGTLCSKSRRRFKAKSSVAIHEIWLDNN